MALKRRTYYLRPMPGEIAGKFFCSKNVSFKVLCCSKAEGRRVMASEWAMKKADSVLDQIVIHAVTRARRQELTADALDAARAQGRGEGLEEKLQERKRQEMILWREVFVAAFKEDVRIGDCASSAGRAAQLFRMFYEKAENA